MITGDDVDRRRLRLALLDAAPWLAETEVGPAAVEAGNCDRCDDAPRVLPLCGPVPWQAVCRDCGLALDTEGWCAGHEVDGDRARAWAAALPADWRVTVLLWWLATGELRALELARDDTRGLPAPVIAALPC